MGFIDRMRIKLRKGWDEVGVVEVLCSISPILIGRKLFRFQECNGLSRFCKSLLALIHIAELAIIGYRVGRASNVHPIKCIILCMLFGFCWWKPLSDALKP